MARLLGLGLAVMLVAGGTAAAEDPAAAIAPVEDRDFHRNGVFTAAELRLGPERHVSAAAPA